MTTVCTCTWLLSYQYVYIKNNTTYMYVFKIPTRASSWIRCTSNHIDVLLLVSLLSWQQLAKQLLCCFYNTFILVFTQKVLCKFQQLFSVQWIQWIWDRHMNFHKIFVLYSSQACCNNMWTPVYWQFTWTVCRSDLPSVKVDSHVILSIVRTSDAASSILYRGTQAESCINLKQNMN